MVKFRHSGETDVLMLVLFSHCLIYFASLAGALTSVARNFEGLSVIYTSKLD